jgi:capsular polysaccharide biosynthesis protein
MLMVTKQQDSGWMHPKDLDMLNKFKEKVLKSNSKSEERIYATRNFLTRSPKNESAIENIFKDRGFTILRMEDLNFIDEINLLHSTNILAGVSGSWQFNSIWMKSNSQIIDIVNENYWTELIHRVCEMKALDYKWFIYNGAFSSEVNELALGLFLNRVVR